jgi:hypothetical protein
VLPTARRTSSLVTPTWHDPAVVTTSTMHSLAALRPENCSQTMSPFTKTLPVPAAELYTGVVVPSTATRTQVVPAPSVDVSTEPSSNNRWLAPSGWGMTCSVPSRRERTV